MPAMGDTGRQDSGVGTSESKFTFQAARLPQRTG